MSHRQPRIIRPVGRRLAQRGIAGIVAATVLALVGVSGAAVADSTAQLNASNTSTQGIDYISPGNWGQTFTATASGPLTQVDLFVASSMPDNNSGLSIRKIGADGSSSAETVAYGGDWSMRQGWLSFPMDSVAPLVKGDKYVIIAPQQQSFPVNSGQYSGGDLVQFADSADPGITFGTRAPRDLLFRTYTSVTVAISGTPTSDVPVGHPYSYAYSVTGGSDTTTAVVDGALPAGLTLSSDGKLSGTPTAVGSSTFTVRASNGSDTADVTSTIVVRAAQPPSAPTDVTATAGKESASVQWAPPTDAGDDAVSAYTVTLEPGGKVYTAGAHQRSLTISNLTPGTPYTFTVAAGSASGDGPASSATDPVTPYTTPAAPGSFTVMARDTAADLSWTAPADGYSPITSYTVTATSANGTVGQTVAADATSTTITGLTNGTSYVFAVNAVNAAGEGPAATSDPATPIGVPAAPTIVSATGEDSSIALQWTPPTTDNGSAVTKYVAQTSTETSDWTDAALSDDGTITGLTNGTQYWVRIAAVNAAGRSSWSKAATATPIARPTAPRNVSVVPGDSTATVSWQAPESDGGSAIVGYRVDYRTESGVWTTLPGYYDAGSPVTITGLQNGTAYQFHVIAISGAGSGAASDPITRTPFVFHPTATTDDKSITGRTLTAGDTVHLHATDLPAGSAVLVQLHSTVTTLATVKIGDNGVLEKDVTIPAGAAAGAHELTLTLTGTGAAPAVQSFAITLAHPANPTPTATPTPSAAPTATPTDVSVTPVSGHTPGGQLAFTGWTISIVTVAGALLAMLIGVLILFWRHRRRPRRP